MILLCINEAVKSSCVEHIANVDRIGNKKKYRKCTREPNRST